MDSTEKQRTLFDSTNNLYNQSGSSTTSSSAVHPLHEIRRPSPSDTMSQTSNTNDEEESGLCSVFEKLKTEEQRRNSSPGVKHTVVDENRVKTPVHRSMSVDVGSVHHPKLPSSASSSTTTRASTNSNNNNGNNSNTPTSATIHNLLSKNLLFDGDPHKSNGKMVYPFLFSFSHSSFFFFPFSVYQMCIPYDKNNMFEKKKS
ncbi:hypothetical protein BDA99DRAFT_185718 [Phascolomyces articulosus]|uniref:Uncharacterized protein n=1 Tax=Phascolomyces articulosus TaxID=60185 RepID=A0AAD5JSS2_9FUNG|nr:hypothetical protein BDA99DRAFT_185718 [Phascolomyces articulosus]